MVKLVSVAGFLCVWMCSAQVSRSAEATSRNDAICSRLYKAFVAPCCWHEPIELHQSSEATQMRNEIAELVREGRTEPEIRAVYIARYGERILVEPEGLKRVLLYLIPWTALALGLMYLVRFVRRGIALQES